MIKKANSLNKNQNGMLLISIMIIAGVLIIIGFSIASLSISQFTISNNKVYTANSLMVAEAGVEQAMLQLNLKKIKSKNGSNLRRTKNF